MEIRATLVQARTMARAVRIRTDNGPGTSMACPEVDPVEIPGIGLVGFRSDGRVVEMGDTPTAQECRRYYNDGIGSWKIANGDLPDAGKPGLAYPNASRHNPAPVGGGLAIARGEKAPVIVDLSMGDYLTKRPHPAFPHQEVDAGRVVRRAAHDGLKWVFS